ncbi:MAG: hypothetical protein WA117_21155 [Verrucomicrobiia bacterium]
MKAMVMVAVVFLLGSGVEGAEVCAALGDTESTLTQKLGAPEKRQSGGVGETLLFNRNLYCVAVVMHKERACRISYKRLDGRKLTTKEMDWILSANVQGGEWEMKKDDTIVRTDGAKGYFSGLSFVLYAREFMDASIAADKARR